MAGTDWIMMRIGNLRLQNWLVMAPMAGITNLAFRLMVKEMGAALVTTEMVSAMGLTLGQKKTFSYLRSHRKEKPFAVQLFGSRPRIMARAAQIAVDHGADLVDINMGCPVRKVVKTGAGAALLREPKNAAAVISAVRLACPVPVTVKIRAGWSPSKPAALETAKTAEDLGVDAITVHPRFATHGYATRADWSLIGRVKEVTNIPVVGNGDVFQPEHAFQMRAQTGCDGVMIGRGAVGNPWIFQQALDMDRGLPPRVPNLEQRRALILKHFLLLSDLMGERRAALSMRGLLLAYSKGLPHSSRFRHRLSQVKDLETLNRVTETYFSQLGNDRS
jgi:nifR3 family TIM-barrel protein